VGTTTEMDFFTPRVELAGESRREVEGGESRFDDDEGGESISGERDEKEGEGGKSEEEKNEEKGRWRSGRVEEME